MSIGENIKKFRIEKKLTQKQLADKIDRSLRMVQKYESGEVEPSIEVLNDIAKVLGTDFIYLIKLDNVRYAIDDNEGPYLKQFKPFSIDLIKELINSLIYKGDLYKTIFIEDDLEILTENIRNYVISQVTIITEKNSLILEALENPEDFFDKHIK